MRQCQNDKRCKLELYLNAIHYMHGRVCVRVRAQRLFIFGVLKKKKPAAMGNTCIIKQTIRIDLHTSNEIYLIYFLLSGYHLSISID